jgi:hypothetical protein
MNANRANLVASEGAFGTHLLRHDLASPSLMFGAGGLLDTEKFDLGSCVGLGLQVRYENLAPMA